jgi:hypothetical protein
MSIFRPTPTAPLTSE